MRKSMNILLVVVALAMIGCASEEKKIPSISNPARVQVLLNDTSCNYVINIALEKKEYAIILAKEGGTCSLKTNSSFNATNINTAVAESEQECKKETASCRAVAIVKP